MIKSMPRLTPRHKQVLDLVIMGEQNKNIAWKLGIAENTVKTHIRNIMEIFECNNRTRLAYLYGQLSQRVMP